jgi:hypothetical protein
MADIIEFHIDHPSGSGFELLVHCSSV